MSSKIYQHNPIGQLKGFYYTAHLGSVSKAAKFLDLSQPSISLQIKAFEKSLGTPLFSRKNHRMELTPHGKTVYKEVGPLLEKIETLYNQFKITDGHNHRPLKIVANHGAMHFLLPGIIKNFWKKHEDCHIHIDYATKTDGITALEKGADAFITPLNFDLPSDYSFIELNRFDVNLLTHKDHPLASKKEITLQDIAQHNLTMPSDDLMIIKGLEGLFKKSDVKTQTKLTFSNWEIVKKFVSANLAITLGADLTFEEKDTELFKYSLKKYFDPIPYGIVLAHKSHPLIEDFIESYEKR